jgi:hypothetical protein
MTPDVVFCHGPFLSGDYRLGETLLAESASVISFASSPTPSDEPAPAEAPPSPDPSHSDGETAAASSAYTKLTSKLALPPKLSHLVSRSRTTSPEPSLAPLPEPPKPRRLVLLALGIAPHRRLWTSSQRPGESVINYVLLNGCPAVVLPAKGE